MPGVVEKVTALITRPSAEGQDLLLFEHPHAGIQIPAGTVEEGETPEAAVLREVLEETGLVPLTSPRFLGVAEDRLPEGQRIVAEPTRVYARPDRMSFDWAYLRKGIVVTVGWRASGFSQVTYQECDQMPDPQYVTLSITGWVPDGVLASTVRRHFFHLEYRGPSPERWQVSADNHAFTLFWVPRSALPAVIAPQDGWLDFLPGV